MGRDKAGGATVGRHSPSNRWLAIEPRSCLLELSSKAEERRLVAVAGDELN
jgi:hypothetical protein